MARNLLSGYHQKRDFDLTAEPRGKIGKKSKSKLKFVIQLHEATRTHYDFRLEWHGVMKSWAVTKGPSYDPADKRLAVRTEDHPVEYNEFEGVIASGQYGAGPVMIWDEGTWEPEYDPDKMEKKGHISFTLHGARMKGHWHLVRMRTKEKRENWLLVKGDDEFKLADAKNAGFLKRENTSVISGRTMPEIRKAGVGKTVRRRKAGSIAKISMARLTKKYGGPELATLVEDPPATGDWVHEIKYDGYRLMAFITGGDIILRTRGMKDWTRKFGNLAKALADIDCDNAVLDLEACVLDEDGKTNFSALQEALSNEEDEKIIGWVFDLLYLNGEDYAKKPLLERKEALQALLDGKKSPVHYSEHFESRPHILEKACKIGAEGLVSKRKESLYHGRRTKDWVKSKCGLEQEFVIGGFMPAKDNAKAVGAVLLGYYKDKKFLYAGKVGTGFTRQSAKDVYKNLIPLKTDKNPFPEKPPRGQRPYVLLKPEMLCEVSFMEWTPDGHLRHGVFKGIREDKNPKAVTEEIPVKLNAREKKAPKETKGKIKKGEVMAVVITNPDREIYPGTGITKLDVVAYYGQMAKEMLPFVKGRFISLVRCTDGIKGQCFFQRNPMKGMGDRIKSRTLAYKTKKHEYIYVDEGKGLVQLAQMGTMEFHAWQSKVKDSGKPDQIIFDLDPDSGVPFEAVKLAAQDIRARLKRLKLESFARLSGGKGIHVVIPIRPEHEWDEVKEFAREFAQSMAREAPDAYVANMSKAKRKGKIFIDFFRNDFSSTAIVPFSLRAREGAAICWPLSWADLKKAKSAYEYTLETIKPLHIKKAQAEIKKFQKTVQSLRM
ncbi:MAG TPA: DNA ligase D [Micavibrio sp.]|nr:DNA ligase D [Micavibrio sp.]